MLTKKDIKKFLLKSDLAKDPLLWYAWDLLSFRDFQYSADGYNNYPDIFKYRLEFYGGETAGVFVSVDTSKIPSHIIEKLEKHLVEKIYFRLKTLLEENRSLLELFKEYETLIYSLDFTSGEIFDFLVFLYEIKDSEELNKYPDESVKEWGFRIKELFREL